MFGLAQLGLNTVLRKTVYFHRFCTNQINKKIAILKPCVLSHTRIASRHYADEAMMNTGDDNNMKRFTLMKRLVWTALFGSTFVYVVLKQRQKREETTQFLQHYQQLPVDPNIKDGGRSFRYKGFVFPVMFGKNIFNEIDKFQARPDDVYVVSFPKTGTTWVQEIVYLIANNLDFETAESLTLETRFPFLEFIYPGIKSINKLPSPRFIKTHLPLPLLPKSIQDEGCKLIYITRNPKDVAVSFFYFLKMLTVTDYQGTFKELVGKLVKDELPYCPFWEHVLPFWDKRNEDKILFLKYEDLHKDLAGVVRQIAVFLEKALSDEEVNSIVQHCNFMSMQKNPMVNYDHWEELGLRKKCDEIKFLRKGAVGDWQNYFTPGLNKTIDKWIQMNTVGSDLQFDYTLPATNQKS